MSHSARLNVRWSTALATAIVFVALGAAGSYVAMRSLTAPAAVSETSAALETRTSPSPTSGDLLRSADSSPLPDVIVTLTDEAMKRAGIEMQLLKRGRRQTCCGFRLSSSRTHTPGSA